MSRYSHHPTNYEQALDGLLTRLRHRRFEIEQAVLARINAIPDKLDKTDPEYLYGIRTAVSAGVDYGLAAAESSEEEPAPIPLDLLAQARLSARQRVNLDTVLRRYVAAGHVLADFFVTANSHDGQLRSDDLQRLLRSHSVLTEFVLDAISDEYERESKVVFSSPDSRLTKRVQQLLAGQLVEPRVDSYDFRSHHLGVIAKGSTASNAIRKLAKALHSRVLIVPPKNDVVWAWFGIHSKMRRNVLEDVIASNWPANLPLGLGELSRGLEGWRLSHQQAKAAFAVATNGKGDIAHYVDVALVASMIQDDVLVASMHKLYLEPLARGRDGGTVLRQTLRAYFEADRNGASAAAALGVSRQTITNRLRVVEERLKRPLSDCANSLEAALDLEEIWSPQLP